MKVGDRVKINKNSKYYRIDDKNNPKCIGTIIAIDNDCHHNIIVLWDNKRQNGYNFHDLKIIEEKLIRRNCSDCKYKKKYSELRKLLIEHLIKEE